MFGVMFIYTGQTTNKKLEKIKYYGMGICITSSPSGTPAKDYGQVPCFLDNGAFSCWLKGYPFQKEVFLKTLNSAYSKGIKLDFIVCPDIVTQGKKSLKFSMKWALNELFGAPKLALAVQDGMSIQMINDIIPENHFSHIFVGGSNEWKWKTAEQWVEFAHSKKLKAHIGRCGTFKKLIKAYEMGADSVDSTNWVRNDNWKSIEKFLEYLEIAEELRHVK